MSAASDAIRNLVTPLLPGWRVQFGRWVEGGATSDATRFAVIRPVGGGPAELVRRPQFSLSLIGARDESSQAVDEAAGQVIERMRTDSAGIVFLQPGEPVFVPTSDGRPVIEIAVSAITT